MTNEAVERLRTLLMEIGLAVPLWEPIIWQALSFERRATVDRVRSAIALEDQFGAHEWDVVSSVLDAEANRILDAVAVP